MKNGPTLLQINVTANLGSTGKIAEEIGILAIERGWRSVIAYGQKANPSKNELIRVGNDISVLEHGIESRLFDKHGLASRNSTRRFIRNIDEIQPDVIHLHNIHGYYLNYQILFDYLTKKKIPIIWTLHDCWAFTGHCSYFDYSDCDKWKNGCNAPCPCKRKYPKSLLFDRSNRNFSQKRQSFLGVQNLVMVPVSEWLGGMLKLSFLKDYPVQVIHNGIDLDVFKPSVDINGLANRYNLKGKKVLLGVANIWEERKGLRDFIKLRYLLSEDYTILLVGVNEKQQQALSEGIIGISRAQNQQELAQIYSFADIFLNLTYEDNYPTTNLEAMACGTPIVTYRTGGSPEAVTEETGWVVEKGDVDGVAAIVKSLELKDKSEIDAQQKACRTRAEKEFDKNKCFEKYFVLYDNSILAQE